jgi:endo-1,4-beta-D-glucanase Y
MQRLSRKQLSIAFLLVLGVIGAIGVWYSMVAPGAQVQKSASASQTPATSAINRPFPQNLSYPGCIKPSHVTQADINNSIMRYYDHWKSIYVKQSSGVTPGGGYYVHTLGTGGSGNEITTSEAHGYGMIIFALMAGYDSEAKQYFDGMYNMFDKHRSTGDPDNMSWIIDKSELASKDQDDASDGDMDIAYSLLLAHHQWGSNGKINYLNQAKRLINNGIKESDMSLSTKRVLLGGWSQNQHATRTSDWMIDHFIAYREVAGDDFWKDATQTIYDLIKQITTEYSPETGLVPDFVVGSPARPARPRFLEAATDGDYSWNACRYPWRLATAFAHYGSPEARAAANKVVTWLKKKTEANPMAIKAGYKLDGTQLVSYSSLAFTSPFIAACIVDSSHQPYLNTGWDTIINWKEGYYGDTINLLSMLLISGNWWAPIEHDAGS